MATPALAFEASAIDALASFHAAVQDDLGGRLERVVLYGSRARGDARPDSDYDIAVFVEHLVDFWAVARRLADMSTEALVKHDICIHAMPFRAGSYNERTPIMHEIRKDGYDL